MEDYRKYEPVFGSWYIKRKIGSGSFGNVFEITRKEFGTEYRAALKVISVPQEQDDIENRLATGSDIKEISDYYEGVLVDLVNENEIMSRLKGNSNIVSYEDHQIIAHEDGIGYDILIRMELLTPLLERMKQGPLDEAEVVRLGIDICTALELCHKKKIIHRDIKPQNIFISDNGDYKLGDFGIARTIEKTTGEMSRKGTYNYMAPEVFRGDRYGTGADIYSLGAVLYTLLNGNRGPFLPAPPAGVSYQDEEEARTRRLRGEALPAPKYANEILAAIIRKACAPDPADRYKSAGEMKRDLESYRDGYGEVTVREEPPAVQTTEAPSDGPGYPETVASPARKKRRQGSRLPVIIAVVLAAAAIAAGAVLLTGRDESQVPEEAAVFNGHSYMVYDEPMTWTEAKAACEEKGGHLATVTSREERDFISGLVETNAANNGGGKYHYWLGGTDEKSEGSWEWVTGETWGYSNWCENQPNDGINDINHAGQDYLELQVTRGDQGDSEYLTWNDINNEGTSNVNGVSHEEAPDYCSTKYFGYICEWDE